MGFKALFAFDLHHLRVADAQQVEGPPDGAGVDRLPEPIQNEHGMFEYAIHQLSQSIVCKLAKLGGSATEKLVKALQSWISPADLAIFVNCDDFVTIDPFEKSFSRNN